eukprot:2034441-Pyramimonas_sp.AAC.1
MSRRCPRGVPGALRRGLLRRRCQHDRRRRAGEIAVEREPPTSGLVGGATSVARGCPVGGA